MLQRDVAKDPGNPNVEVSRLLSEGAEIGWSLMGDDMPAENSPIFAIAAHRSEIAHGRWSNEDITFLFEAISALLGTSCAHVVSLANSLSAVDPVLIHPVMTLIRSEAEAAGLMMWVLEPFIAPNGVHEVADDTLWFEVAAKVLARAQLLMFDSLNDRAKRHRADGNTQGAADVDERSAQEARRIEGQHPAGTTTLRGTDRRAWRVAGEQLPTRTDQAIVSTEYAYGQDARFSGMNPYPMLSGHAHASLDVTFAYRVRERAGGMRGLFAANSSEATQAASLAIRILAASMDFFANAVGQDREALDAWIEESDEFVLRR